MMCPLPETPRGIRTAYSLGYTSGRKAAANPRLQPIRIDQPDRAIESTWDAFYIGFLDGLSSSPPRPLNSTDPASTRSST